MKTHAFRLRPGEDLRAGIDAYVAEKHIQAGAILTCVGNLKKAILRMADETIIKEFEGTFEIVSLTGTVRRGIVISTYQSLIQKVMYGAGI